jgi:hypothetical protein
MILLNSLLARSPLYNSPELNGLPSSSEPTVYIARRVRSTFALGAKRGERPLSSETSDVELRDLAYLNLDLASHQLDGQAIPMRILLTMMWKDTKPHRHLPVENQTVIRLLVRVLIMPSSPSKPLLPMEVTGPSAKRLRTAASTCPECIYQNSYAPCPSCQALLTIATA